MNGHGQRASSLFLAAGLALIASAAAVSDAAVKKERKVRFATGGSPVSASTIEKAAGLERAFVEVAEKVGPAVVSIVATHTIVQRLTPWGDEGMDEFFRYFFGAPRMERRQPVITGGSGFVVTYDGYILTNAHVIGNAENITVKMLDKEEYKAEIIGMDEGTDLAVLKIKPRGKLTVAPLGDSDSIRVGQWSIAIGNPFALENTVTVGVISAKGRKLNGGHGRHAQYTSYIQTDASINRGNSGGPLLNLRGEVIGINTLIFSPSGGSVGIGFAIPVNIARNIMEGLINEGRIIRPQLGVAYQPVSAEVAEKLGLPEGTGMQINRVLDGTAAAEAGLEPGDIILSMDGKTLTDVEDLRSHVLQRRVGEVIRLEVYRRGKRLSMEVKLRELQQEGGAQPRRERRQEPEEGGKAEGLGMTVVDLTDALREQLGARPGDGVVVADVEPDSPAAGAGVHPYDIIREIEQQPVTGLRAFKRLLKPSAGKTGVLLLIERGGSTMYLVVDPRAQGGGE